MLNYIWFGLILLAVLIGGMTGKMDAVTNGAVDAASASVKLAIGLIGIMALWLGMMRLAEKAGAIALLARGLKPLMRRLFPDVPAEHPAMGMVVMNMAANMLGLGNAATPLGLKAMTELEKLNRFPGTATNAMCTFLALNTSSVQLVPATTVALLAAAGSLNPSAIIGTALLATTCSTIVAIIAVRLLEKLPGFALPNAPAGEAVVTETAEAEAVVEEAKLKPLGKRGGILLGLMAAMFAWFFVTLAFPKDGPKLQPNEVNVTLQSGNPVQGELVGETPAGAMRVKSPDGSVSELPKEQVKSVQRYESPAMRAVNAVSTLTIPFLLTLFPFYAMLRGVKVYEEFVEGAKEGFNVGVRIIPYLVAMLVAIGMFRAAGGVDMITEALRPLLTKVGFPPELLPLSLMRPLSGSGSNAILADLILQFGPDSMIARMAGTIMGSTETTFYVIALYFGSVGVMRTRHAIPAGLLADLTGVVASVIICRIAFT